MKIRNGLIFGVFLLVGSVLSAQNAPVWYASLDKAYPDKDYVAAIGSGSSRRVAEDSARSELAKRFRVKLEVSTVAEQRYREFVKGSQYYSEQDNQVSQKVRSTAEESFANLRFSDPYTDKQGMVNIVAYLVRSEVSAHYKTLIERDLAAISALRQRAAGAPTAFRRLAMIDTAVQVQTHSRVLVEQLDIVNAALARSLYAQVNDESLMTERDGILQEVRVRLAMEGDNDGTVTAVVRKVLEGQKINALDSGRMTVRGSIAYAADAGRAGRKGVRWTLKLELVDEDGTTLVSLFKESLEEAKTDAEARAYAVISIQKLIEKDLPKKLNAWLGSTASAK